MSELIKIEEYEEWQGSLADADWDFLSAELSRQLTLRREIRDGKTVCVLNPNQYVGLIMLPSGTRLQITPKVPVSNLSGWGFYPQLRLRLRRLDTALAEVQPTALPSSAIGRFRYSRFNDDYRQIHQLCRLFLEGSSLSEQLGVWSSRYIAVWPRARTLFCLRTN